MRFFRKVLKLITRIILALVLLLAVVLGVFTAAEYRPADTEVIIPDRSVEAVLTTGDPLSVVSWNCGYGALGDNADFFMDGGTSVYTADKERVDSNLSGIRDALKALNPDLVILQEVDINSARSYGTDERTILRDVLPGASDSFAYNFNTLFVPYPLPPMGHVESGLYTLSAAAPRISERISLPACPPEPNSSRVGAGRKSSSCFRTDTGQVRTWTAALRTQRCRGSSSIRSACRDAMSRPSRAFQATRADSSSWWKIRPC